MNQKEWFEKSGLIEYYLHDSTSQLEEGIELLRKAAWYCREVNRIDDGNRNRNLNDEVFTLLERIKTLHNYWQSEYAIAEDDDWD